MALDAATLAHKSYFESPNNSPDVDLDWGTSVTLFQSSDGTRLVAAAGKDGILYGLRRSDLSLVWTARVAVGCDTPQAGCGSLSTPAFDGQRLYLGAGQSDPNDSGSGSIYAIDPSTGQTIWFDSLAGTVLAPVTVANGVVYASTFNGLMAFNADTGNLLWSDGGKGQIYSQPVVVDGVVYSTYASGEMVVWGVSGGDSAPATPGRPWPTIPR